MQKSDDEFLDLLKEMKLVHATKTCPACNRQMKVTKNRKNLIWQCSYRCAPNHPRNRKRISFFNGTFFEGTHLSPKEACFWKFSCLHSLFNLSFFKNCHITGQGTVWNTRKSNMKWDEKMVVPYHRIRLLTTTIISVVLLKII